MSHSKIWPEIDVKVLTRLWEALRRRDIMPESGIFSGWTLSTAYTSASTAWRNLCQGAPRLVAGRCLHRLTLIVVEAIVFLFCPGIYDSV